MDRFPCQGTVRITAHSDKSTVRIAIAHAMHHVSYCDIGLPDEVRMLIEERKDSTAGEVSLNYI